MRTDVRTISKAADTKSAIKATLRWFKGTSLPANKGCGVVYADQRWADNKTNVDYLSYIYSDCASNDNINSH